MDEPGFSRSHAARTGMMLVQSGKRVIFWCMNMGKASPLFVDASPILKMGNFCVFHDDRGPSWLPGIPAPPGTGSRRTRSVWLARYLCLLSS